MRMIPRTGPARPLGAWLLVLAAVVALAACGQGGASSRDGAEGIDVPAALDSSGATAQGDGAAAFAANCTVCHGPQGQGTDQGPPLVHIVYEPSHHGDDAFRRAAAQGVVPHHWDFGPMPPLPDVTDAEIEAIIAHVRSLQREAGID